MRFLYRSAQVMRRSRSNFMGNNGAAFRASLFGGPAPNKILSPVYLQVALLSTLVGADGSIPAAALGDGGLPATGDDNGEDDETRFRKTEKDRDRGPGRLSFRQEDESDEEEEEEEKEESFRQGNLIVERGVRGLKEVLRKNLNDEPYRGPVRTVVVGRRGMAARSMISPQRSSSHPRSLDVSPDDSLASILPLDEVLGLTSSKGKSLKETRTGPGGIVFPRTEEEERAGVRDAVLTRRAMRALYQPRELESIAAAFIAQHGSDLDGFPLTPGHDRLDPMVARRMTDFRPGEDPIANKALPFDPAAVTVSSNMNWNASPGSLNIDAKVTLTAYVSSLGLEKETIPYVKLIAGPRYHKKKDLLRISSNMHKSATANKREVMERFIELISHATKLKAKHGKISPQLPMPKYRPFA